MTTTDLRPLARSGGGDQLNPPAEGPFARIVASSFALAAISAAALTLAAFPGAEEHVTTGVALLAFAAGWAMLATLTSTMTNRPQRWAYQPAGLLATSGSALLLLAPGDDGLAAAAWVWPPLLLVTVIWCARQARNGLPRRGRWLVYGALAALALTAVGATAENVIARALPQPMSMPGTLHDVGGHRLHMQCTGTGSPTVVTESGLGGTSRLWTRIVSGTAPTTRVCTYDRAGTGWSEDAARAQDSAAVVADLHKLLTVAGETGPYVLVGHSTGGVYAMTYAATHPGQIAGMVLLDASSPQQFTILPKYASQYSRMKRMYGVLPTLTRIGIARLAPALSATDIPGDAGKQASAFLGSPRSARTAGGEVSTFRRSFAQAQALTSLGSKPLIVLSASDNLTGTPGWRRAQEQLAALSSNAGQRDVNSTHGGLLDHPISSIRSVDAIHDVVQAVRTGGGVAAS
jgi:pimeloyl-ACP methyl ester carboxylesterase